MMKKYDEQILKAAIMAAKAEETNTTVYYRNEGKHFILSFVYQGTSIKVCVKGEDEVTAKNNAFNEIRSWFNKRVRTGWTRAELDKECLNSQKHLLFWRENLALLPIVQKAAKLEEDKKYNALRKYVEENLGKSFDYSPKHLMRMYEQIPSAWKKAAIIERAENHRISTPEKNTATAKVSYSERDGKVIYRVRRSIVCYREGSTYHIGKPSDHCTLAADVGSEEVAHERCMEIANERIELAKAVSLAS